MARRHVYLEVTVVGGIRGFPPLDSVSIRRTTCSITDLSIVLMAVIHPVPSTVLLVLCDCFLFHRLVLSDDHIDPSHFHLFSPVLVKAVVSYQGADFV